MTHSFQHPYLKVVSDTGYADFLDHLQDELRVLNLRLLKELGVRKENLADREANTRGLYVTEEEIHKLIHALNDPARVDLQKPETENLARLIERGLGNVATRIAATGQLSESFPLRRLARIFGLSPFEIGVLVMALAPDVDRAYERIFAFFNDDLTSIAVISLVIEAIGVCRLAFFASSGCPLAWSNTSTDCTLNSGINA